MSSRWCFVNLLLLVFLSCSPSAGIRLADAAEIVTRDEALTALHSPDAAVRLDGVNGLAQLGEPADAAVLLEALYDADPDVRLHAQGAVWQVWGRSGNPEMDALLKSGIHHMEEGRMGQAVEAFTRITERLPDFAEGWNKRATVYYLMGEYKKSLADCDEVMKRNPFHYGALSGYGMIYIQLDEPGRALEYYERALDVNPNLDGVKNAVEILHDALIRKRRESI